MFRAKRKVRPAFLGKRRTYGMFEVLGKTSLCWNLKCAVGAVRRVRSGHVGAEGTEMSVHAEHRELKSKLYVVR